MLAPRIFFSQQLHFDLPVMKKFNDIHKTLFSLADANRIAPAGLKLSSALYIKYRHANTCPRASGRRSRNRFKMFSCKACLEYINIQ